MSLFDGWAELLASLPAPKTPILVSRVDPLKAAGEIHRATDAESGRAVLNLLRSADIGVVAVSIEAACEREPRTLRNGDEWRDIRSMRPRRVLLAALVAGGCVVRAELDISSGGLDIVLEEVLSLRATFVFHDVKPALFAMWGACVEPELRQIHDTHIAAACLDLGRSHRRSHRRRSSSESEAISTEERLRDEKAERLSLAGQLAHYGIAPCESEAESILRLYLAQQAEVVREGLVSALCTIEFPFAVANARVEWNGVYLDPERMAQVREASGRAADHYKAELAAAGVRSPGSGDDLRAALRRRGTLPVPFDLYDETLAAHEHSDALIRAFRLYRRYSRLAHEDWLSGHLTGADGRVHPVHQQLGAATGRNSCRNPNVVGIGRVIRPVVAAPPGRAIVELDYAQVEIGVAAAELGDLVLVDAYNSGDVYSAIAQGFYEADLTVVERGMSPLEFKRARPDLRDRIKVFVLGVLYNLQAPGIAKRFGISLAAAERERGRFLDMYQVLKLRLGQSVEYGLARGYAMTVSGLRRHVEPGSSATPWTQNFLRNTPIQGSAAVVFKHASVLLDKEFAHSQTRIILTVHDAVVIECDERDLDAVTARAAELMRFALKAWYPRLRPRVDVNRSAPWCWNKDGHADSIDRFLDDPTFSFDKHVTRTPEQETALRTEAGAP